MFIIYEVDWKLNLAVSMKILTCKHHAPRISTLWVTTSEIAIQMIIIDMVAFK